MGAVSTFRGARISKRLVVLAAMIAAFALGGTSGYAVKALSLPATPAVQQTATHSAAAQDADGNGPQSDLTRVLPGEVPSAKGQP
jgi:hypothetical protein